MQQGPSRFSTTLVSSVAMPEHKSAEFEHILTALGKNGKMTCTAAEIFSALQALRLEAAAVPFPAIQMVRESDLRVIIPGQDGESFPQLCVPVAADGFLAAFTSVESLAMEQVTVTNPHTGSYETVFLDGAGKKELDSFVPCKSWGWLSASLCPVRTGKVRHLAADLLLPTTVNQAARVQNIAARFFAILGSIIFDIMTLTLRVMSVVPRAIYNALQPHNKIRAFLLEKGVSAPILEEGIIHIRQLGHAEGDRSYNLIAFPVTRGLAR